MSSEAELVSIFRQSYHQMIKNSNLSGLDPMFKPTQRSSIAITELEIPYSERTFIELIENLHLILNEGSGNGTRLPQKLDENRIAYKIRRLRNYYVHDPSHGTLTQERRKHKQAAATYKELIGTETPYSKEHWHDLGIQILDKTCNFLTILIERYPDYERQYSITEPTFEPYYEHDITIFPEKRVPYLTIKKKAALSQLASAPIFVPHTSYMLTPEFGYDSNNAIHFSSSCYNASIKKYETFLNRIQELWEKNLEFVARDTRDLYPWSISSDGEMKFGSGFSNLVEAVNNTEKGVVSILLAGCFGEDYSKTFYIVISNYWKYDRFRDNQLDIYLSNIPLDYGWVCEFNDSMKILSESANVANSYSLKPIISRRWRSEKKFDLRGKIIGGLGRDGYKDKREWDTFNGIIMENPFSAEDFELEEHYSLYDQETFECPVEAFDTIVMSVTNSPPDVEEILSGRFVGVSRPMIDHIILDGGGHEIHAILFWGWSLTEE